MKNCLPTFLLILLIVNIASIKLRRKLRIQKHRNHKDDEHELKELDLPKPKKDYRQFYSGKLENGLEVLIVSDKKEKRSQAGLSVKVGAMMDPINLQGMAHFTEHMLFQGSEKYNQSEGYFFQKVAEYGGGANAYTTPFITNYMFSVQDKGLDEVLDIWANFFISPLFSEKSILKEINAVNSEYEMKVNTQTRSSLYGYKLLIQKKHPMSKFTVGNYKSLLHEPLDDDVSLIKSMKEFFNTYYSANIMKLCISTKQDPFQLFQSLKSNFGKIKNNNIQEKDLYYHHVKLYRNQSFLIKYQAKKELKQLDIHFEIEYEYFKNYDKKSIQYILAIFNNQGVHGFKKYLIDNDFLYTFHSSLSDEELNYSVVLKFAFVLTDKGYDQIESIVEMFFQYVDQLQQQELDVNFYNYLKKKANLEFQMQDEFGSPSDFTADMQFHNVKDILYFGFHYDQLDSHDVKKILKQINIESAQYTLTDDKFKYSKQVTDKNKELKHRHLSQKHKYHNLAYEMIKNPFTRQQQHKNDLKFTISYNSDYIPDSLEIGEESNENDENLSDEVISEVPMVIEQDDAKKVWYYDYQHKKQPFQLINANIYSDISCRNATQKMLNQMLAMYIQKVYSDYFFDISSLQSVYDFQVTGLYNRINVEFKGPKGYSKSVIQAIIQQLIDHQFTETQYNQFKEKELLKYHNTKFSSVGAQINEKLRYFINKHFSLSLFGKQKLKQISYEQFMNYRSEFIKSTFVEGFCMGNISQNECSDIFKAVGSRNHKIHIQRQKVVKLQKSKEIVLRNSVKVDNNQAIMYMIQNGEKTNEKAVILNIFRKQLRQVLFDYLRTQKQLGYSVGGYPYILDSGEKDVLQYIIQIVGVNTDVDNYEKEIKNAINLIMNYFEKLEQSELDRIKESSIKDIKMSIQKMNELFSYFWDKIDGGKYEFWNKNQQIQEIRKVHLDRVKEFMEQLFMKDNVLVLKMKRHKDFDENDHVVQKEQLKELRRREYY